MWKACRASCATPIFFKSFDDYVEGGASTDMGMREIHGLLAGTPLPDGDRPQAVSSPLGHQESGQTPTQSSAVSSEDVKVQLFN